MGQWRTGGPSVRLYVRLDTEEGDLDLLAQRDGAGNDVQQVRLVKNRDGNVLICENSMLRRWKEDFKSLV